MYFEHILLPFPILPTSTFKDQAFFKPEISYADSGMSAWNDQEGIARLEFLLEFDPSGRWLLGVWPILL